MVEFNDVQRRLAQMEVQDAFKGRVKPNTPGAYKVGVDFMTNRPVYAMSETAQRLRIPELNYAKLTKDGVEGKDLSAPFYHLTEPSDPNRRSSELRKLWLYGIGQDLALGKDVKLPEKVKTEAKSLWSTARIEYGEHGYVFVPQEGGEGTPFKLPDRVFAIPSDPPTLGCLISSRVEFDPTTGLHPRIVTNRETAKKIFEDLSD